MSSSDFDAQTKVKTSTKPVKNGKNDKTSKSGKPAGDKSGGGKSVEKKAVKTRSIAEGNKNSDKPQKGSNKSKKPKKIKVLFVCTGNTCRSPMAEHIFKHFLRQKKLTAGFDVSSAGLYAQPESRTNAFAVRALGELGIKTNGQNARQLTETIAEKSDIIICMTAGHKTAIEGHGCIYAFGELTGASDVPDPYGCDVERYVAVAKYLEYACTDILSAAQKSQKCN